MTIHTVEFENFRCFSRLRLTGLTRVNVFVGRNNSGKSSALEGIEAVVSERSPFILYRPSLERGEFRVAPRREEPEAVELNVRPWFHGHTLEPGTQLTIRAEGQRRFSVSRRIVTLETDGDAKRLGITLEREPVDVELSRVTQGLPLRPGGFLGAGPPERSAAFRPDPPVVFVTTRRLTARDLLPAWSAIVLTPAEAGVLSALRVLEPRLERIALTEQGGDVLFAGAQDKVPLGSLGEGTTRMLTLALSLAAARDGFLLIDEIELGLHYTAHRAMWRLVVETASRLGVQVFCTSHSKDCIEAIARLHEEAPALAAEISVHRLETVTATRMSAETIASTTEGGVDVR